MRRERNVKNTLTGSKVKNKFECVSEVMVQKKMCSSIPKLRTNIVVNVIKNSGIMMNHKFINKAECTYEDETNKVCISLGGICTRMLFTWKIETFSKELVVIEYYIRIDKNRNDRN